MTTNPPIADLNEQDRRRVGVARDAFLTSLQSGLQPVIDEFLAFVPERLQAALLVEIVRIEILHRRAAGEVFSITTYAERFPAHVVVLDALFQQLHHEKALGDTSVNVSRSATHVVVPHEPTAIPQKSRSSAPRDMADVPKRFGRYRIEKELGRGGMGAVFLAHDEQLDRKVALKVPFFQDEGSDAVERFYREARAMATFQHANLCPVFDVGQFEQWHFLTMAYIDGEPLSVRLRDGGLLPMLQAVRLMKTVALAVQKAHDKGIIHRDLKPANIMLTQDFEPVIMDFGLARRRMPGEAELTHSGVIIGSPAYMAPEQVESRLSEIGPPTDVYAMGVVLYQMLTGVRPFEGSVAAIFGQIVSREADAPSKHKADLHPSLDALCLKALAKTPGQRHATAKQFADELSQLIDLLANQTPTVVYQPVATSPSARETPKAAAAADSEVSNAERSRREAELRQVTVAIFSYEADDSSLSDASHSGTASHSELLLDQSKSFGNLVVEQVQKFGGATVLNSGQEVVACFGFPQAFEDAAQRAVRAALEIRHELAHRSSQRELPNAQQLWVVLHSGEAVAEELTSNSGGAISLVGDARNTVQRLSTIAEPGNILISAATHQRVSLFFECESIGAQRVRGMSQPVELFKVHKAAASRNRVELVDPGNLTPLVGRDTELTILKDRWEQALDELGQIVLLIGDAGLGKSRLIRELREHVIREDSDGAAVIELRCSQYHQGTSHFPLVEFFGRLLDFENRSPADRLETVARYLGELRLDSTENVALMCCLLNVPTDARYPALTLSPQKIKERTDDLLLKWLQQLVKVGPVLFIVEDLHWLDPSTLELLEKHVLEFESGRVLSVLTFRPEFETPWKSKPHQTQIALNRLTKRQIGEMMRKRIGRREIPEAIVQQVIDRTDGIPLFIEEFSIVIVESGLLDRADAGADASSLLNIIPATLHDLLLSRLDRMAADREVIQLAATIGREFSFELLAAACSLPTNQLQQEVEKLVKAEILFQKGQGAEAGYIFKHALLQDAAYRSMLTKKRQACHQRIAEVIERKFPDIVASQPALLAHHFTEAGLTEQAIAYWLKAGQRSQEQSANVEAIAQFQRGIELALTLPESPQRDMLELSLKLPLSGVLMAVQGYAAPEVEPVQNRCIEICRKLGDGAPLFPVLCANWEWLFIRGRFDDCYRRCPEVVSIAEAVRGPGMIAEAYWSQNCTSFYAGDFISAEKQAAIGAEHHHRAASIEFAKITQQNSGPLNLAYHGMALWQLGYTARAFQRLTEAVRMAEELKHVFTLQMTLWKVGQTYDFAGLGEQAIDYGGRTKRIADEQGFAFWVALGLGCEGVGLKHLGRFKESIAALQAALAQLEATGSFILFPKYRAHLADSLWQTGQREAALKQLDQAFADQCGGEYFMHSELLRLRGDFAFDQGYHNAAEAAYREAQSVAQRQGARMYELRTSVHLARLWKARNQRDEIPALLTPLLSWFTEGFEMPDLQAANELLSEV